MKRVVGILVLLALAYFATACSHPPSSGTVVDRHDNPAYSYWVAGIDTPATCTMVGKIEDCNPGIHIPGHEQYVPESWSLKLSQNNNDGKKAKVGWRDVGQSTYDSCQLNSFYPDCAK